MKISKFNVFHQKLLFNSRTGALVRLDENGSRILKNLEKGEDESAFSEEDHKLLASMKEAGILVDDVIDELGNLLDENMNARADTSRMMLTIAPTMECNMTCRYCFEKHPKGMMSERIQDDLLKFLESKFKQIEVKKLSLTWYGGEPLLAWSEFLHLSQKIRDLCASSNVVPDASIITNGFLLDHEKIDHLYLQGIQKVQITLDGPLSVHDSRRPLRKQVRNSDGSYDRIIGNVNSLASADIDVDVRVNFDMENSDYAEDLLADLATKLANKSRVGIYPARLIDYNANGISCFSAHDFAFFKLEFLKLCERYEFSRSLRMGYPSPRYSVCVGTHHNSFAVDPRGDLYKCLSDVGTAPFRVGSLSGPSDERADSNLMHWSTLGLNEACAKCTMFPACGCGGRCPRGEAHCDNQGECYATGNIIKDLMVFFANSKFFNTKKEVKV